MTLIRRLGAEVGMLGGDVMEVAPPFRDKPDSTERTVALAVRYLHDAGCGPPLIGLKNQGMS